MLQNSHMGPGFTTEVPQSGAVSPEMGQRVMAGSHPGFCRAVYFNDWNHGTRKQEAGAHLACQIK